MSTSEDGGLDGAEPNDAGSDDASTDLCPASGSGSLPTNLLDHFGSGSRLKARYLSSVGMPDVFVGFFDPEASS